MENEIMKIDSSKLDEVIVSSGLAIQEGEAAKQSYMPFLMGLADIQEQSKKIDYENPTQIDEKIARELRLKTVKIRTAAADLKDERKRIHMLKGNLEQASYNLIASSCKLAEETFVVVEKATELKEKKRIEELALARETEMSQYTTIIPPGIGTMQQEVYDYYLNAAKLSYEAKIEADKKAEEERIERELAEVEAKRIAEEQAAQEKLEQQRKQAELEAELARQKELADAKEKELEIERAKAAEELRKQQEIADAKIKAELEKAAEIEREAAKLRQEAADKLLEEQLKNAKLEADVKAARDAEIQKELDRVAAAELAAKAPFKQKAAMWVDSFILPEFTEMNTTTDDIKLKFEGFKKWAKSQIQTI